MWKNTKSPPTPLYESGEFGASPFTKVRGLGFSPLVPICSNHIMFAQDLHHNQIVTFDFNASFTSTFMCTIMEFYRF